MQKLSIVILTLTLMVILAPTISLVYSEENQNSTEANLNATKTEKAEQIKTKMTEKEEKMKAKMAEKEAKMKSKMTEKESKMKGNQTASP